MSKSSKKEKQKAPFDYNKGSFWFGVISGGLSILIALIYGQWGIRLSNKQIELSRQQDSTSINIDTFKALLLKTDILISQQREELLIYKTQLEKLRDLVGKTDTVISVSAKQLSLNEKQQKIANRNYSTTQLGEMNRLYSTAHLINNIKFNMLIIEHTHNTTSNIEHYESIRKLMFDEIKNSYLNSHSTLHKKWEDAYQHLDGYIFYINQSRIGFPLSDDEMKKSNEKLNSLIFAAVLDVQEHIDSERRKSGIVNEIKKGDLVSVNPRYPKVVYKALKHGKEHYIFVRVSKDSIPNMSDTLESYYPWAHKIK